MHPEGREPGQRRGRAADPKEASIDKTLLHYITLDARAHRLDLITLMRVAYRALAVILHVFRIFRYKRTRRNIREKKHSRLRAFIYISFSLCATTIYSFPSCDSTTKICRWTKTNVTLTILQKCMFVDNRDSFDF